MDHSNAAKKSSDESWREESIQSKQKALLEFLKMPVPPTRGAANNLIKAVFEGPAGNAHQNIWNAAKYELHPDLYPPEPKKTLPIPKPPSFFGYAMKAAAVLAVIFYAMDRYYEKAVSPPLGDASNAPDVTMSAPVPVHAAKETIPQVPERQPVSDIISLQGNDGRMIKAKVLALTKETVLIRREDGQTFDLPLNRLTADSKQRIDEYRAAKRAGSVK